jgi:hypothetical protein
MVDNAFSFAIAIADKTSKEAIVPFAKNEGLQPIDKNNVALFEAIYNGGKKLKSQL